MNTLTKQQRTEYNLYVELCEEFGEQPKLLEGDFVMGERNKREYKAYRVVCLASNVEPTIADFLLERQEPQAMAASAGR